MSLDGSTRQPTPTALGPWDHGTTRALSPHRSRPPRNNSGEIDAWELRNILKGMGRNPSDEDLFELISLVDTNMSGAIDFTEFLQVIDNQKANASREGNLTEIVNAWVAVGGETDKSGTVKTDRIISVIKDEFRMKFDIVGLLTEMNEGTEGEDDEIDWALFRKIFQAAIVR